MGKFYLHRGNKLIGIGSCPDGMESAQAVDGLEFGLGDPPPNIRPEIVVPVETYDMKRVREYPRIGDQLDALWKLFGPTAPAGSEAKTVFDQIVAVKAKYPKPNP